MRAKANVKQLAQHLPGHLGCLAVQEGLALLEVPGKKTTTQIFKNLIINRKTDYVSYLSKTAHMTFL